MKNNEKSSGMSLGMVLFLIFLVLKLTNHISWSWWWVTCPLWIYIPLAMIIGGIVYIIHKKK